MQTMIMQKQQGATLVIGLILLFLLTILGLTATRTSSSQELMSGNLQNKEMSFQAAESALRGGEDWIATQSRKPLESSTCSSTPCVLTADDTRYVEDLSTSWWSTNAASYSGSLSHIATAPAYSIEYQKFVPDDLTVGYGGTTGKHFYKVTSKGTGGDNNAESMVQISYTRRY